MTLMDRKEFDRVFCNYSEQMTNLKNEVHVENNKSIF